MPLRSILFPVSRVPIGDTRPDCHRSVVRAEIQSPKGRARIPWGSSRSSGQRRCAAPVSAEGNASRRSVAQSSLRFRPRISTRAPSRPVTGMPAKSPHATIWPSPNRSTSAEVLDSTASPSAHRKESASNPSNGSACRCLRAKSMTSRQDAEPGSSSWIRRSSELKRSWKERQLVKPRLTNSETLRVSSSESGANGRSSRISCRSVGDTSDITRENSPSTRSDGTSALAMSTSFVRAIW